MQEIPYQPENDESGGETKHKSSSEHSNPQLKNDNDGPDVISKENNPIMSRYIRGVSNEDKQESISKLEFQNERRRTKRKRASGTDISDSDSDDVEHRSSTTCTPDEILKVRSRHHKRLKHSPENTKVGENKITDVSRISSESTVSSLVCEISPVEDRNEIFKCDRFDPENTTQVSVNTKSKSKYHKHLSKDSFQPVNSDGTKDTLGRLTFLHDSPSIDLSVDAADSLDLDNEFTLRSQKEKYDALERVYQQDGLEPTELSLSDEFTCESQSIGNI